MDRKDVETKYTWDLSKFYSSDEKWFADFEKLKKYNNKFLKFKGKLNNKQVLKEYLNLSKSCSMLVEKLSMYSSNNLNTELSSKVYNVMQNQLGQVITQISTDTSFVEPELLSYDESYLKELLHDADFKNDKFWIKDLIKDKKHVLSEKEEKLLNGMLNFAGDTGDIFDSLCDVDFKFEDAISSDKKHHE